VKTRYLPWITEITKRQCW